jgi:SAM-dependent methyltransferase
MLTLKQQFLNYVVQAAVRRVPNGRMPRIMDLGCGTASYVPQLRKQVSNFEYVGVEPIESSFKEAEKNLADIPNAKVHFQLGYGTIADEEEGSFDLVFSLSVLEHIKQLDKFIALSAKYTRSGGTLMHRYDLGHALHPHSLKERFHVWLGNTVPQVLPERKFVRYVGVPEVEALYDENGVEPTQVTYHQMPNHKHIEKFFTTSDSHLVDDLFAWEQRYQDEIKSLPVTTRENLFPAVAVWGSK